MEQVTHPVKRIAAAAAVVERGAEALIGPLADFLRENRGWAPRVASSDTPKSVRALQAQHGVEAVAGALDCFFAALAWRAVADGVTRLVVAGSETSGAVVSVLGLDALATGPETAPGVPAVAAVSGPLAGAEVGQLRVRRLLRGRSRPAREMLDHAALCCQHRFPVRRAGIPGAHPTAKAAGFKRVGCHFSYEYPVEELRDHFGRAGVQLTELNFTPASDAEDWGLAGVPGREAAFHEGFEQALAYVTALKASLIHVMAGLCRKTGAPPRKTYIANMRWADERAARTGVTLVLEPLNARDNPGHLVSRSDEIVDILVEIDRPEVKLLFDVYDVQIMEEDVLRRMERFWDRIDHVQVAAVSSRAEPDESEVNPAAVLAALDARNWAGLVGLEYMPWGRTEDGLGWIRNLGRIASDGHRLAEIG